MKTKEFKKRVEELGFEVWINGSIAYVLKNGQYTVASIKTNRVCAIDFFYHLNESLDKEISKKLFDIIVEYARTPLDEREEPKKYYLRYKWINADYNYLNYDHRLNVYGLDRILNYNWTKNKFTREEIKEIKQKSNTDLSDFEEEEVEE